MKNDTVWCVGMWIVIVVLVITNVELGHLGNKFDKYCTTQYNISDECPCKSTNSTNTYNLPDSYQGLDNISIDTRPKDTEYTYGPSPVNMS